MISAAYSSRLHLMCLSMFNQREVPWACVRHSTFKKKFGQNLHCRAGSEIKYPHLGVMLCCNVLPFRCLFISREAWFLAVSGLEILEFQCLIVSLKNQKFTQSLQVRNSIKIYWKWVRSSWFIPWKPVLTSKTPTFFSMVTTQMSMWWCDLVPFPLQKKCPYPRGPDL